MIQLTKIFHFETAHAIHRYAGACRNIHGHSYELHVTITTGNAGDLCLPAPGFILDFKEMKQWVHSSVIESLDHKILLSHDYLDEHPGLRNLENLLAWDAEPSAENMLMYIRETLKKTLPRTVSLVSLKLYETKDSYAEWVNRNP